MGGSLQEIESSLAAERKRKWGGKGRTIQLGIKEEAPSSIENAELEP